MKFDDKWLSAALPWEVPDYHQRQAAHWRSLAANATTVRLKDRLLREAQEHEDFAESGAKPAAAGET